jgi:hypothetical protein
MDSVAITPNSGNTAVATPDFFGQLAQQTRFQESDFDSIAKTYNFLPYIKLWSSNAKEVQRGQIQAGDFGLQKNKENIPLGKSVNVFVAAWRPKAMVIPDGEGDILSYFNVKSDEFKRVVEIAAQGSNNGHLYGPEYLLWLPDHGFCTFFCSSKTSRNEAGNIKALMHKHGVLTAQLIENDKYSWHGPKMLASAQNWGYPDQEETQRVMGMFLNPRDSVVETATPEEQAKAGMTTQPGEAPRDR